MKQHDDPSDRPRPLADLSIHLPPPLPIPSQTIPKTARTDELTTHLVTGSTARFAHRREHVRHKVAIGCLAGDDPIIHVEHPPHILEPLEENSSVPVSNPTTVDGFVEREKEGRLLDKVLGRKRRLEVVIELPVRRTRIAA